MSNYPCKNCKRKGCGAYHDKCPEYKKYRESLKKINEKRKRYNLYTGRLDYLTDAMFWQKTSKLNRLTSWYQEKVNRGNNG